MKNGVKSRREKRLITDFCFRLDFMNVGPISEDNYFEWEAVIE